MSRLFRVKYCTLLCHCNYMLRPTELHARHSEYNYLPSVFLLIFWVTFVLFLIHTFLKQTCTSELQQQAEQSGGMEVSRRGEVLASHRLPGQRGHSSPRIPSVVFYRPRLVSQSAHRLPRKCSLSVGSLRFPPRTFDFNTQTTPGLRVGSEQHRWEPESQRRLKVSV